MNPYSHIVVAAKLESLVQPENNQEYYWGAIAPDIRYLAAMQRSHTHLPSESIIGFISQYPHLKAFLQGYLIHCLSDEIELGRLFFQWLPFPGFKARMPRRQMAAILELYYFETERLNKTFSASHNEVLHELGLSEGLSAKFSQSISQYALSSSPQARMANLFTLRGRENDKRIDKYAAAAKRFQESWLLKNGLFFGIKTGRVSEQIVSTVASLYQQCGV